MSRRQQESVAVTYCKRSPHKSVQEKKKGKKEEASAQGGDITKRRLLWEMVGKGPISGPGGSLEK